MGSTVVIENKKARYDYFVEDSLECGIELRGNEVKSIREGRASIKESWISVEKGDLIIKKMHISAWNTANKFDVDEDRDKKLLAHKKEIADFERKVQQSGYTLIPLKVYFTSRGKCKLLVGLCKGKHQYDKRRTERDKQVRLDIERTLKEH